MTKPWHITSYAIDATIQGSLWWPIGQPAQKQAYHRFHRSSDPITSNHPVYGWGASDLEDMAETIMVHEAGDFSGPARMTADSCLIVTRLYPKTGRRVIRTWPLSMFPSLSDYVDADAWTFGEDDDS